MSLEDICYTEGNHAICIRDCYEVCGMFLLKDLLAANKSDSSSTHVFCYDRSSTEVLNDLSIDGSSIYFHENLHDPLLVNGHKTDNLENFVNQLKFEKINVKNLNVVIDSVCTILLNENFPHTYKIINELIKNSIAPKKPKVRIFLILHEDVIVNAKKVNQYLSYLCKVWITVKPDTYSVAVKRSNGAINHQTYEWKVTPSGIISQKKIYSHHTPSSNETFKTKKVESIPWSSFKMTLNSDEKQARELVQLPYIRNQSVENDESFRNFNIHYTTDEYDDWDEEEPDNDLEFASF